MRPISSFPRAVLQLLTLALTFFLGVAPCFAQSGYIRVRAFIDGRSRLVARADSVHWAHLKAAAPGLHQGARFPTDIWMQSGQDAEQHYQWCPLWPPNGCNTCAGDCGELRVQVNSLPTAGLDPQLPVQGNVTWALEKIAGRGDVRLVQVPGPANDFTLIVEFDDHNGLPGPDWYEVRVRHHSTIVSSSTPLGSGCPGSAGTPVLAAAPGSRPQMNSSFSLAVTSLPATQFVRTFGIVGFSNTNWAGISLPQDLGFIGAPGCTQYVSADVVTVLPKTGTTASWDIQIPNNSSLFGLRFFLQALVNDVTGPVPFSVSNGIEGIVGNQ